MSRATRWSTLRRFDIPSAPCATLGTSEPRPNCRGPHLGPHNRCSPPRPTHPTAPPRGYRRCAGDGACPIRLPDAYPGRFCFDHADLIWTLSEAERYAELAAIDATMRGRPSLHRTRLVARMKAT